MGMNEASQNSPEREIAILKERLIAAEVENSKLSKRVEYLEGKEDDFQEGMVRKKYSATPTCPSCDNKHKVWIGFFGKIDGTMFVDGSEEQVDEGLLKESQKRSGLGTWDSGSIPDTIPDGW